MKKVWENPQITVEQFEANEYVAACDDLQNVYYNFVCDAGGGVRGDVWEGGTVTTESTWWGGTYQTISGGTNLTTGQQHWFYACDASHYVLKSEADANETFTAGYYNQGTYNDSTTGNFIPVTIWKGENNDDVHCMTNLGVTIETVKGNKS